jgi:excisionase family DNA binding protein
MVMREYFIELIKKARTASPTEKLQIEADLALIVKELLKPFSAHNGGAAPMEPRYATPRWIMTTTEVAQYFQIHAATVHRLIRRGQIPCFKIGSDYRFYKDDIDEWIADP